MNLQMELSKLKNIIMSEQSFEGEKTQKTLALQDMILFNSTKGTLTNCNKCNGNGYIAEVVKEFNIYYTVLKECSCIENKKSEQEVKRSGTNPLLEYNFENYNTWSNWQNDIKNKAIKNAKTKDWFFIGGQSGSGKTHICSAITNYQRKNGIKVKYMIWTDDINKAKSYENTSYIDEIKRVECLYIDDLFKRAGDGLTSSDIKKTWEIINFRALNKLKTVISTEMTLDDILNTDESLGSRIKENAKECAISLKKDKTKNIRLL